MLPEHDDSLACEFCDDAGKFNARPNGTRAQSDAPTARGTLFFALLTIVWEARRAFAAMLGRWAYFDAKAPRTGNYVR